jgi:hypothetical protein
MNLHLFGASVAPVHNQQIESFEHPERAEFQNLVESLDEGGEYADDALRMTDQPYSQE